MFELVPPVPENMLFKLLTPFSGLQSATIGARSKSLYAAMLVLSPPDDWVTGGTGGWLLRVLCALLDATTTGAAVLCDAPIPAKLVLLVLGVRFGVNVGVVVEEAGWL